MTQSFQFSLMILMLITSGCFSEQPPDSFKSQLPPGVQRTWIGPHYWANPLQDWCLNDGRMECIVSGGNRNVFLLTYRLDQSPGDFKMRVRLGRLDDTDQNPNEGYAGFKIGIRGQFNDFRDDAVHGQGFPVGITMDRKLFIGALDEISESVPLSLQDLVLELDARVVAGKYDLVLSAYNKKDGPYERIARKGIDPDWLFGGVSLICSYGKLAPLPARHPAIEDDNKNFQHDTGRGGNVRFWFSDWELSGSKVRSYPEQAFGPILFTQYTLSDSIMKMTAQMPPVGDKDPQTVRMEIQAGEQSWQTLGDAKIDSLARTATFRVENWNSRSDINYRLSYGPLMAGGEERIYTYEGTVRKEPWDQEDFVVAAFTGNNDLGFPNSDIMKQLLYHDPDLLFFSGDQIYEGVGGYGIQRLPLNTAALDYLRKWYIYGWTYRDLMKNRPTVSIPDDHDVYHGNIWGEAGKAAPSHLSGYEAQDPGGYRMLPAWVNMVQRTQTSHLPDPYDPTPVKQGIGVYYCAMNYAGISFAILEDRKFKSAPKPLLPQAEIENGWATNKKFNAKQEADIPGAVLLGDRQLNFLHEWSKDWRNHTWMKVALSQTIFANVATLPREETYSDKIVPKLRILKEDEYPADDIPVSDMDSNGWPQSGRNKALQELRRCFALHIAGDQHLGSIIQYGIDKWHDAGYAFCVPAISNVWPRRWYPSEDGKNRPANAPRYTGDFEDGFGNKISVLAVSNPVFTGLKPSRLYDRATGYGIVRFNRMTRDIIIECWPRLADSYMADSEQYTGWPIKINQIDNSIQSAAFNLPEINIQGLTDPVVQVIDESNDEVVYTLRIRGDKFQPKVYHAGSYRLKIGDPGSAKVKEIRNIPVLKKGTRRTIQVDF
jgi:alkaline phosphatase D